MEENPWESHTLDRREALALVDRQALGALRNPGLLGSNLQRVH